MAPQFCGSLGSIHRGPVPWPRSTTNTPLRGDQGTYLLSKGTYQPVAAITPRGSIPRPPNVPLLRALWSLLDGTWGLLKGSSGVLVQTANMEFGPPKPYMVWFLGSNSILAV